MRPYSELAAAIDNGGSVWMNDGEIIRTKERLAECCSADGQTVATGEAPEGQDVIATTAGSTAELPAEPPAEPPAHAAPRKAHRETVAAAHEDSHK
jgi:hypothetical protein